MEKLEYRAVIKFLQFVGKTPSGIKAELDSVYEDAALLLTIVKTIMLSLSMVSIFDEGLSGDGL